MDFVKEDEYKMMINGNSYFISRGVDPVIIFTELNSDERNKLLDSHFQINCQFEDYIKGLNMVTNYLKQDDTIEKIEFIEPKNVVLVQELINLGYNVDDGIIRMKGRML